MKIPTIFNKNLKIVSRNWNYFTILFICPILLILLAGLVLNSVDFSNIKVGIVDKSEMYDLNLEGIRDISHYDSLTDCLTRLTNSKVNVCIYINKTNERNHLDIYLDNSQKIIEYYSKQIILNTIFQEQSSMFEEFSGNIDSRLSLYSTSISNAKNELFEVGFVESFL